MPAVTTAVQSVSTAVDAEEDRASITVVVEHSFEIEELFGRSGELRLWQDSQGWSGLLRDDGEFYRVNYHASEEEFLTKEPCSLDDVRLALAKHIDDEAAGKAGEFVRGCSPP